MLHPSPSEAPEEADLALSDSAEGETSGVAGTATG